MSAFDKHTRTIRFDVTSEHNSDTDFLDQINSRKFELTQAQVDDIFTGGRNPVCLSPVYSARAGTEEALRSVIRARNDRMRFLPTHLFADPAWDMLLDLYLGDILSKRVSVSSLGRASNVPMTTALRWIGALAREGLIERTADHRDGRRSFVSLSESGLARMDAYFESQLAARARSRQP